MRPMQVLLLSSDKGLRTAFENSLNQLQNLKLCGVLSSPSQLDRAVSQAAPDLIVTTVGSETEATFSSLSALGDRCPEVIMCGPASRTDLILRALQFGARDFVPLPHRASDLPRVVDRMRAARDTRNISPRGFIVSVIGAKGGVGATVVTCQVAAALQHSRLRCVILDLNLERGDVALYHNLTPAYGIADLDRKDGELDQSYLQSLITTHESGVGILACPLHFPSATSLQAPALARTLELLRTSHDFILVDHPKSWTDTSRVALQMAHQRILVTSLDAPSLAHSKLQLRLMERAGIARSSTLLVSNGEVTATEIIEDDFLEFIARPIDVRLPADALTIMEAINSGTSVGHIDEDSSISRGYQDLANTLRKRCGIGAGVSPSPQPSIARVRSLLTRSRKSSMTRSG